MIMLFSLWRVYHARPSYATILWASTLYYFQYKQRHKA